MPGRFSNKRGYEYYTWKDGKRVLTSFEAGQAQTSPTFAGHNAVRAVMMDPPLIVRHDHSRFRNGNGNSNGNSNGNNRSNSNPGSPETVGDVSSSDEILFEEHDAQKAPRIEVVSRASEIHMPRVEQYPRKGTAHKPVGFVKKEKKARVLKAAQLKQFSRGAHVIGRETSNLTNDGWKELAYGRARGFGGRTVAVTDPNAWSPGSQSEMDYGSGGSRSPSPSRSPSRSPAVSPSNGGKLSRTMPKMQRSKTETDSKEKQRKKGHTSMPAGFLRTRAPNPTNLASARQKPATSPINVNVNVNRFAAQPIPRRSWQHGSSLALC